MKLETKVQWAVFKEKVFSKAKIYYSILWRKFIQEKVLIAKILGIFLIFLIALQSSRLVDSIYRMGNNKKSSHDLEKKLDECESSNIKYRTVALNLAKKLKITEKEFNIDERGK
jgi:hypothetical protein